MDDQEKAIPKVIDTLTETQLYQQEPLVNKYIYRSFKKFSKYDSVAKE